jgi:hypothetical protein
LSFPPSYRLFLERLGSCDVEGSVVVYLPP